MKELLTTPENELRTDIQIVDSLLPLMNVHVNPVLFVK